MSELGPPSSQPEAEPEREVDFRKALLAGIIGGVVAAGGYLMYQRLEDEQRERIRDTVVGFVQEKISEIRAQLKM